MSPLGPMKYLRRFESNRGQPKRTHLLVEQLECREVPAALAFVSPAGVYGSAALNGGTSAGVKSLLSFNSGDITAKSSGWSEARSALSNYSGASSYKTVTATTSAYATGATITSAQAIAMTTKSSSGYSYVTVQVLASNSGEEKGQTARVTLKPSFVSTLGVFNTGYAANSYSFYVGSQQHLGGTVTTKGTGTYSKTITLNTTIGSTFQIAFQAKSYVGFAGMNKSNTAWMQFSLGLEVTTSSGGGGSGNTGGGLSSAPAAPNKPTWSSAGGKDIYLKWNDVAGESSYRIQYWKPSTSQWVTIGTLGANASSVKITSGFGFYFRIGAENSFGTNYSPWMLAQ